MSAPLRPPTLALSAITRRFGAVEALRGVNLDLRAGEALALMGDNGAGKSTLARIIGGAMAPTSGELRLDGRPVAFADPAAARAAGIEVVHQNLALCDNLSAALNVFLGRELTRGVGPLRWLDRRAMQARAADLFAELKSDTRPEQLVRRMSGGQRQAVAIARTRLSDPRIILMDEPTAAISVRQVGEVLAMIERLKATGHAVVLISHRMQDVFGVCDRVAVLRRGEKVADRDIRQTSPEEVTALITGAIESA